MHKNIKPKFSTQAGSCLYVIVGGGGAGAMTSRIYVEWDQKFLKTLAVKDAIARESAGSNPNACDEKFGFHVFLSYILVLQLRTNVSIYPRCLLASSISLVEACMGYVQWVDMLYQPLSRRCVSEHIQCSVIMKHHKGHNVEKGFEIKCWLIFYNDFWILFLLKSN